MNPLAPARPVRGLKKRLAAPWYEAAVGEVRRLHAEGGEAMHCPKCDTNQNGPGAEGKRGNRLGVIDTRETPDGNTRRRRACWSCGFRFTTLEMIVSDHEGGMQGKQCLTLERQFDKSRDRLLALADKASEMAESIRAELNEQTVLSL